MDRDEARTKFREADRLFNERQFAKALASLTEIDATFPNQRHILYPMARCLAGLRRNREAADLAERIARDFEYAPAKDLHQRLMAAIVQNGKETATPNLSASSTPLPFAGSPASHEHIPTSPMMGNVDHLLERPDVVEPTTATGSHESVSGSTWVAVTIWIALIVFAFGVDVGVSATVGKAAVAYEIDQQKNGEDYFYGNKRPPEPPWQPLVYWFVAYAFHFYILSCVPAYWALRIVDGLRYRDFGEDMKDVATFTLYGFLFSPIIILGWIGFLYLLRRHFELSAGKLVGVVVMFVVFDGLVWFADQLVTWLALFPLAGVT